MKKMKKIMSLALALVLAMAMGITAFAQTEPAPEDGEQGKGKITIKNAAMGETYMLYKLFDATVSEDSAHNIAYKGSVPTGLENYFTEKNGYIYPNESILEKDSEGELTGNTTMTEDLKTALENWANTAKVFVKAVYTEGNSLEFTNLPYGYYVVTTTHTPDAAEGEAAKAAITVTSTQPSADIYDKNVNKPTVTKTADKDSYSIGDTITYTATFDTTNYMGEGENSKQVIKYVISDTLSEYLSNVKVTSVTISEPNKDDVVYTGEAVADWQFNKNKEIEILWADKNDNGYTNKYAQGTKIVIEYTAMLTSTVNINVANTNTISITPYVDEGPDTPGGKPWDEPFESKKEIKTYAAAIKKVDETGQALAGAEFTIRGLTVTKISDGVYTVVSYDSADNAMESEPLVTDLEGKLYIIGLAEDVKLIVTEYKAPDGYNKLTETETLEPQSELTEKIYYTSGTKHYDKDGNLVEVNVETIVEEKDEEATVNLDALDVKAVKIENKKGTLLPSTGGIGTTIFYVVGAVLVIGAGVLLVTKRRMRAQ